MSDKKSKNARKNIVKSKQSAPDFEKSFKEYKKMFYDTTVMGEEMPQESKKQLKERYGKRFGGTGTLLPLRHIIRRIAIKGAPDNKVLTKKEFREEFNKQIKEKQPFKKGGLIRKSKGGKIDGNTLVASLYKKG
tara:strand:- start:544 stop:945 length:402 start_codon:yes stop_codon:yes gene_type:complete